MTTTKFKRSSITIQCSYVYITYRYVCMRIMTDRLRPYTVVDRAITSCILILTVQLLFAYRFDRLIRVVYRLRPSKYRLDRPSVSWLPTMARPTMTELIPTATDYENTESNWIPYKTDMYRPLPKDLYCLLLTDCF